MPNKALEGLKALAAKKPWYTSLPPAEQQSIQELREHLHAGDPRIPWARGNMPEVYPPAVFQPDPLVVGSPELARQAKKLLDLDPRTKAQVNKIVHGPTRGTMQDMVRSKLPIDAFQNTNLLGQYSLRNHDIALSPRLNGGQALSVLAHEIAHAAGHNEAGAEKAQDILALRTKR